MSIYRSDLRFQLLDYTASHKKILFRSPASSGSSINTDIIFTDVASLEIKTDFYGIDIAKQPPESGDDSVFSLKCLKTGSISTITAWAVSIHENDLSLSESSLECSFGEPFDDYWRDSKYLNYIYPNVEEKGEKSLNAKEARKLVAELGVQSQFEDHKELWEFETTHVMNTVRAHDWASIRKMVLVNPKFAFMRFFEEWRTLFNELLLHGADEDTLRFLLEKGADVNRRDFWGETPLFNAVRSELGLDVVRFLIEQGARIDLTALNRIHVLHLAARYSSEEVLEYLLSCGANPCCETSSHQKPIDLANTERKKEILRKAMIDRNIEPE